MKRLNRIAVVVIAIVGGLLSASAQSRNSYFMEGSYFRTEMNPALVPTRGYISLTPLGGIGVNLNNNFLSVNNFVYQRDGGLVTAFNSQVTADEFLKKLPTNCNLGADLRANLLGVGFYTGHMFWNFGANLRANVNAMMPSGLISVVKDLGGNGTIALDALNVNINAYFETYLGASIPIGEHVNLGVRLKYLSSLYYGDISLKNSSVDLYEDRIGGNLSVSGVLASPMFDTKGRNMTTDEMLDSVPELISPAFANPQFDMSKGVKGILNPIGSMLKQFNNWGLAADLGVEVRLLDDQLRISAAVTDLGFLRFHNSRTALLDDCRVSVHFNGLDIDASGNVESDNLFNFMNGYTIDGNWGYVKGSDKGYTTMLNCTLNAGVEYNILRNHIAFGVLSHTEFVNKKAFTELTASVNFRPTNWISATFSHTFLNNHAPGVLGFALNIHPRVVNFFVGLDYIDTRFGVYNTKAGKSIPFPKYMNSVNVYFGFGWNFARPKWMRNKKVKAVEPVQPVEQVLPAEAAPVVAMMR